MQYLSDEQQRIVSEWTTEDGAMIVEAPAGSGKTRVLTESVRVILKRNLKEKFRILCITFTNKAAEEMQERLKTVKGIRERAFIGTIHAFCLSILKAYHHELGYEEMPHIVEREYDRKEILKRVFSQNPILEINRRDGSLEWISEQKRKLIFLDNEVTEYNNWDSKDIFLYKEYNNLLRNQNLIDFDDILLLAWCILSEKPHIASLYQRLYKYVLVDEAQDLNFAQYQIIRTFCGDNIKKVLMVGDENQAIHGYAGASKDYMFKHFVEDFQATSKKIEFNYRSSKRIIELANQIMPKGTRSAEQHFEGIAEICEFKDEQAEAEWIIRKIKELKELLEINADEFEGQVTLEKIAVLARNKFVFRELQKCLDKDQTLSGQYFLKKGADTLTPESDFMKVFDLGTRLLTNRHGEVYLNQLVNLLRIDLTVINHSQNGLELLESLKNELNDDNQITQIVYGYLLESWQKLAKNINQFHDFLQKLQEHTRSLEENERDLAQKDIEEWSEAWKSYVRHVPANNKSLADFRRYTAMGFNKSNQLNKGLTLATIHTVKGLEFDIVFLMGMNEGTFPDYRSLKKPKALEEEKNNAYVAVTRAKRHIYISYPKQKMMPWGSEKVQDPSSFLPLKRVNKDCF